MEFFKVCVQKGYFHVNARDEAHIFDVVALLCRHEIYLIANYYVYDLISLPFNVKWDLYKYGKWKMLTKTTFIRVVSN